MYRWMITLGIVRKPENEKKQQIYVYLRKGFEIRPIQVSSSKYHQLNIHLRPHFNHLNSLAISLIKLRCTECRNQQKQNKILTAFNAPFFGFHLFRCQITSFRYNNLWLLVVTVRTIIKFLIQFLTLQISKTTKHNLTTCLPKLFRNVNFTSAVWMFSSTTLHPAHSIPHSPLCQRLVRFYIQFAL